MKEDKPRPVKTIIVNSERRIIPKTPLELVEWQFDALSRMPEPLLPTERFSTEQGDK